MTLDVEAALSEAFAGRGFTVIRREFDWVFSFEEHRALVLTTPWRIVAEGRIVHADADHGQRFGLDAPIDGADRANRLIAGRKVKTLRAHPITSDLTLGLENGVVVEVLNGSSGYEAWQAEFPAGDGRQSIIGMGGGGYSIYAR